MVTLFAGDACRRRHAQYPPQMTDAERIEALLDIVDETRAEVRSQSEQLVVLGYAERRGKNGFWPTNAGWNFLGDLGRPFDIST
ncbi:MAG: hypothetical protein ACXWVS_00040 [Hyphomicrobium sp.]